MSFYVISGKKIPFFLLIENKIIDHSFLPTRCNRNNGIKIKYTPIYRTAILKIRLRNVQSDRTFGVC